MNAKVIRDSLSVVCTDQAAATKFVSLCEACEVTSGGGMTFGHKTVGKVVVIYGKLSLADEKRIRVEMKNLDAGFEFSRTNDVKVRCGQYDIAADAKDFAKRQKKAETEKKAEETAK